MVATRPVGRTDHWAAPLAQLPDFAGTGIRTQPARLSGTYASPMRLSVSVATTNHYSPLTCWLPFRGWPSQQSVVPNTVTSGSLSTTPAREGRGIWPLIRIGSTPAREQSWRKQTEHLCRLPLSHPRDKEACLNHCYQWKLANEPFHPPDCPSCICSRHLGSSAVSPLPELPEPRGILVPDAPGRHSS